MYLVVVLNDSRGNTISSTNAKLAMGLILQDMRLNDVELLSIHQLPRRLSNNTWARFEQGYHQAFANADMKVTFHLKDLEVKTAARRQV